MTFTPPFNFVPRDTLFAANLNSAFSYVAALCSTETSRATNVETILENQITGVSNTIGSNSSFTVLLNNEISRAENAEASLANSISLISNTSNNGSGSILSLSNALTNEINRAETAEASLANSISTSAQYFVSNSFVAKLVSNNASPGFFSGLQIQTTSVSQWFNIVVSANMVTMQQASGLCYSAPINITITSSVSGLNGTDTLMNTSASSWYAIWVVSDGNTVGGVLSESFALPNTLITSSYPYYARIGAVSTSGSGLPNSSIQYGKQAQYILDSNTTVLPVVGSSSAGSVGNVSLSPSWIPVSVDSFVPSTASSIHLVAKSGTTSATVMAAPNSFYGNSYSHNPAPMIVASNQQILNIWMMLESNNIYWASSASLAGLLQCLGWEDNL